MSTNPFDIDARTLERHDGVSSEARGRWAVEAQQPVVPKRFHNLYATKQSSHRLVVGENEDRWEQEAYQELIRQHPWINAFAIRPKMTATDAEGYAVGFFHLMPRQVPQSLASEEVINVVTIPILIRDHKLYPFDVFAFKESLYPLTEERVVQTLRMRDIFTEVDRDRMRFNLNRQDNPMSVREMGQPSYLRDPFKHSSATGAEAAMQLLKQWSQMPRIEAPGPGLREPIDTKSRVYKESAAPAAVRIRVGSDTASYDVAWASDPDTGRARREDAVPVRLEKISQLFGEDVMRRAVRDGVVVLNQNPEDTSAVVQNLGLDKVSAPEAAEVPWSSMLKTSAPTGAMWQRIDVPGDGGDRHTYYGVPVNCYSAQLSDDMSPLSRGLLGWLTPSGKLMCHDFRESCFDPAPRLSSYIPDDLRCGLPESMEPQSFCHYSDYASKEEGRAVIHIGPGQTFHDSDCVYVWEQDGSVFAVGCLDHEITTEEGDTACPSTHRGFDEVVVCEDLVRATTKLYGSIRRLYIPDRASKISTTGCQRPGHPIRAVLPPRSAADTSLEHPTPLGHLKYHLKVGYDGRKFAITSPDVYAEPPVFGDRASAEFELAARGCPPRISDAVLKASEAEPGTPQNVGYNRHHFDAGAELYAKVSELLDQKLRPLGPDTQKLVESAGAFIRRRKQDLRRIKTSAPQSSPAIDTVLHLNFLTEKNLLRFIDLIPQFEKTLSALCALLVASRMGLEEVEDSSVEAAIDGMDSILGSLRVIEFSLANN